MPPEPTAGLEQLQKSIQTFNEMQMEAEIRDQLWRYQDAFMQSVNSILSDGDCDDATKVETFHTTLAQYTTALTEFFPKLITNYPKDPPEAMCKTQPDPYDHIEEVEKFNPYHDEKGRFATSTGYNTFTIRTKDPSKQHWADAAIAREKERDAAASAAAAAKPKRKVIGDPKTIAGLKPGNPMTRAQADGGNANPNFGKAPGYNTNCQSCVVTYEARLRGYDVTTKPNTKGSALEYLSHNSHEAWINPKTGKPPERPVRDSTVTTPKKCLTMMENTIQPGERYTLGIIWKGRRNSGHIICADRDSSGNLRLYDPQNGKTMTGSEINSYLGKLKYTATVYGQKFSCAPRLLRVDNLVINPAYADGIMEAKAA